MGSIGPVRVLTASPEATGSGPYQVVPNQYSVLDKTDLVFVDAVGTGYSRPVGKATMKNFAGTDQDVQAFSRFIQRYVSVNHRWNSPKFLFGESYGTTRSAALVDALETTGMSFNGVILMSTILNYFTLAPGSDVIFIGNLPTYAAIAWHFEKVVRQGREEKVFLDEVRAFARGPYAEALALGHNLPAAQVDAIAAKLAGYTGLTVPYIKEANLRVSPTRFRKELLRDQRIILGRYDARFEGTDVDAAGEAPGYDPSSTGIMGAFVSALHDYLDRELKYTTKEAYLPRAPTALQDWDHTHRPPGASGPVASAADERCLRGGRFSRRHPQESAAQSACGERTVRSGNAVLHHRVRPGAYAVGTETSREYRVHVLPLGPHDLPERGCVETIEIRSGRILLASGRRRRVNRRPGGGTALLAFSSVDR
jgi:carboxypeptidase C (cathepsin A)